VCAKQDLGINPEKFNGFQTQIRIQNGKKKKFPVQFSHLIISLLGAQVQGLLGESGSMCSRCYHNNRRPFFFSTKNRNRKIRTERKRGDTSSPTHHQKRIEYLDNQIEIEKKKKKFLSTPFQTKFHFPCVNNFLAGTKIQQKKKKRERKEMKHFSFYANVEER
jgi:hypothetical protein